MDMRLGRLGVFLLSGLFIGLAAAGCGSGTDTSAADQSSATVAPSATPPRLAFLTPGAVAATAAPTTPPTVTSSGGSGSTADPSDPMGDDALALGEQVFLDGTAKPNQIGCQYCHAPDGKGNIGPDIRGRGAGDVAFALDNVEAMLFLRLNDTEIEAISQYLQWLATQP